MENNPIYKKALNKSRHNITLPNNTGKNIDEEFIKTAKKINIITKK